MSDKDGNGTPVGTSTDTPGNRTPSSISVSYIPQLTQQQKNTVKNFMDSKLEEFDNQQKDSKGVDHKRKFYETEKEVDVEDSNKLKKAAKPAAYAKLHKAYITEHLAYLSLKSKWLRYLKRSTELSIGASKLSKELEALKAKNEVSPDVEMKKLKTSLQITKQELTSAKAMIAKQKQQLSIQVDTKHFDLFISFANDVFPKLQKFKALYRRLVFLTADHVVASPAGLESSQITHQSKGPKAVLELLFKVLEAPHSDNKKFRDKYAQYSTLFFNGCRSKLNQPEFHHKLWTMGKFGVKTFLKFAEFRNETADRIRKALSEFHMNTSANPQLQSCPNLTLIRSLCA